MTKPDAWAIFNPVNGRWTKACPDCAQDLHPVWLPKLGRHGAWLNKTPVVLVPQRADDGLHQGDYCDLCPRNGRRAVWTGTEWDMRSEVGSHRGSHEVRGSASTARRRVTTSAPSPLPAVGSVNGASSPEEVPVLLAPEPGLELEMEMA